MKKSDYHFLINQIKNKIEKINDAIKAFGNENNPCVLAEKYRQQGSLIALEEVLNALTGKISNIDLI
jgi:predicted ribosome quality control (RQC) complex YloA/Tae2 family protein